MAIWSSLRRKGIRLSIDRHKLLSGDEQQANPWNPDNMTRPDEHLPQVMERDSFLGQFAPSQLEELTLSARLLDFTPPDCVYREGDPRDSVYIITDGRFSVHQVQSDGSEAQIGVSEGGECIGLECLVEDGNGNHTSTVRAERYSIAYKLDISLLKEIVSPSENVHAVLDRALEKRSEQQQQQQQQYLQLHAEHKDKAERLKHHALINLHVREHIEDIFSKPFLHRFLHLLSPRTVERDLLEAIMAACALLASARGEIDEAE
jgi:CRP-like cAMP-binding protein